jgi:homospermidine synthase
MRIQIRISEWFNRTALNLRDADAAVSRNNLTSIVSIWVRDRQGKHLEVKLSMDNSVKLGRLLCDFGNPATLPKEENGPTS